MDIRGYYTKILRSPHVLLKETTAVIWRQQEKLEPPPGG